MSLNIKKIIKPKMEKYKIKQSACHTKSMELVLIFSHCLSVPEITHENHINTHSCILAWYKPFQTHTQNMLETQSW